MGGESSKENNRQNQRPRQYVYDIPPATFRVTHQSQSPPQGLPQPLIATQKLNNTPQVQTQSNQLNQPIQPNPLERSRAPYNLTSQDLKTTKTAQAGVSERSRQPYNFNATALQNGVTQPEPQNLYPNLNLNQSNEGFVVVNHTQQRTSPQPSAPPASEVNPLPETYTPTQLFNSKLNATGQSSPSNYSTNKNKPSSGARGRNNKDKLSCPTCSQRLGTTIFQCSGGHSSCKDCRLANRSCGTCLSPIIDMRNIMLEAYIAELKTNCPNQSCTLNFSADGLQRHLKECPFGEMDCPMGTFSGQCAVRCKVADMAAHFDTFHKEQRSAEIDKEMYIFNICMETHKMFLIKNGPYTFLVHIKVDEKERKISMTVQLLGTQISAEKWTYEFHVYNKRQPLRKFMYSDSCKSIGNSVDDIFKENQCATLPLTYAMTFVNESALTYKFYIKKGMNQRVRKSPRNAHNTAN